MILTTYAIRKVYGAETLALILFACALVFFACCLLLKANRTKRGIVSVLLSFLAAEVICDFVWFTIYFPGGSYDNPGLRGIFGLLLWPALLISAGVIGTKRNIARGKMK